MERLRNITNGLQQFTKTEEQRYSATNVVCDLIWLWRRSIKEDKALTGNDQRNDIFDVDLYLQRLLEIGFLFREIFILEEYRWAPQSEVPRIIDLGGDIGGFSVVYWKSLAPKARVTLVEANPSTAAVISEYTNRKGLRDIQIICAAASDYEGEAILHLHKPGKGYRPNDFIGGRENMNTSLYNTVSIPTIKASTLIGDERIDLFKMDIEGAEGGVLRELAASGKLGLVDEIIMEFHNDPTNSRNSLSEVLQILKDGNFTIDSARKSGRARKTKTESVDIYSLMPSDKLIFMLHAKRKPTSS